jgi:hypothetical protein
MALAAEDHDHREDAIKRELISRLICETVQSAVDEGKSSTEGGQLALERILSRHWEYDYLRFFAASAIADHWRTYAVRPEQERWKRAMDAVSMPPHVMTGQLVAPAIDELKPMGDLPVPRVDPVIEQHGRPDAVSVLSKDIERLLQTPMRVAGIWARVGELKRKDVLTLRDENRERALAVLAGLKNHRARLVRIASRFENDAEDLRDLVLTGRISHDELRACFESER